MPRRQNTTNPTTLTIKAKRASVSAKKLKQRYEAGEDITGQRALVRMGPLNTAVLTGQEDLSLWEDEELARGQRKDKNGGWCGKTPTVIPKLVHDELVRRTLSKAQNLMRDNLVLAVETLMDIVKGTDVEPRDKLKAIEMIVSRTMGSAPVKVEVTAVRSRFEEAFDAMIVPDDTVEAESWEDEDDAD